MPGQRTGGRAGILTTYTLGIFSGITSSCCAPVLAGVIALSSVAPTFWLALGLGIAYVFGMVMPLFLISLLWEYYDWKSSRLFHPRLFTWHLGSRERTTSLTSLASGFLLLIMGIAMTWVGIIFRSMPPLSGWQAWLVVDLQQIGRAMTGSLGWLPNWIAALAIVLFVLWLSRRALRQVGMNKETDGDSEQRGEHPCVHQTEITHDEPEEADDPVYTRSTDTIELEGGKR